MSLSQHITNNAILGIDQRVAAAQTAAQAALATAGNDTTARSAAAAAQATANAALPAVQKGAPNGVMPLDAMGRAAVGFLGTGTPDGTKFLRDDGTYVTPLAPSSGQVTLIDGGIPAVVGFDVVNGGAP